MGLDGLAAGGGGAGFGAAAGATGLVDAGEGVGVGVGVGAVVLAAVFEGGLIGADAFAAFDAVDLVEAVLWAVTLVTSLLTAEALLDVI